MPIRIVLAALAGIVAGIVIGKAFAQGAALEPTAAAPHIFEEVFANERVRVLRMNERNGETAPLYALKDRVVVHVNSCAWVHKNEDGSERMYSYRPGDVYWQNATVRGGKTSNVIQQCHTLQIEVKD